MTGVGESSPLALEQRWLWRLYREAPASAEFNVVYAARVAGADGAALSRAVEAVVARHDALRMIFSESAGGALQAPAGKPALARHPAAAWSEEQVRTAALEVARRPFVLEKEPPFRAALFERAEGGVVVMVFHHIAIDSQSLLLFLNDLGQALEGAPFPAAHRYADFVRWQEGFLGSPAGVRQRQYWKNALEGVGPGVGLPGGRRLSTVPASGRCHTFTVPAESGVTALAQREEATPFHAMAAAFLLALAERNGERDFPLLSTVVGRPREFSRGVGCFMNEVVLRIDLGGGPSLGQLVRRVKRATWEALDHQYLPYHLFCELQSMVSIHNWSPPRDDRHGLMSIFLDLPGARGRLGSWELEPYPLPQQDGQDHLALYVAEWKGAVRCQLKHDPEAISSEDVASLAGRIEAILAQAR